MMSNDELAMYDGGLTGEAKIANRSIYPQHCLIALDLLRLLLERSYHIYFE